jgi:hypothetical protein
MNTPGKNTKEHLLAYRVAEQLVKAGSILFKQKQEMLVAKIESFLVAELQVEIKIDAEAKAVLAKYEKEMEQGRVDSRQMFIRIKKKLINDRNIILQSDPSLTPEDKINHIAHVIQSGILRDPEIEKRGDAVALLQAVKKILSVHAEREKEVQDLVRSRLAGRVLEGSEAWELMYQKAYTEIAHKRGVS